MFFRILTLAVLWCSSSLLAEFHFPEYAVKNVKNFIDEISEEFPPADKNEYKKAKKEGAVLDN